MKRKFLVSYWLRAVAVALMALLLLSGVATARRADRHLHQRRLTFDLIAGITTDPFYITMEHGARSMARAEGVRLISLGAPDSFRPGSQIPYVDLAIAQHPDAILIVPTDRRALVRPLRRAVRAGIPVITVDTSIVAPLAVTHVGSRNFRGGVLAADALAQAIHSRGAVIGVSVRPGVSTTDLRERGFVSALRHFPHIQYLGTSYDNDIVMRAASITANQLTRRPGLSGIFAMNTLSGAGVTSAIITAGRQRQVRVVEFDTDPIQVYSLRRGIVDALIAQDPWTMGHLAVGLAYRWVTGHRSGIKPRYFTQEAIITRANVDDPQLRRFLYTGM